MHRSLLGQRATVYPETGIASMPIADTSRRLDAADIETSPLSAAVAALLDAPIPEMFFIVCEALADTADADDLPFLDAVDRAQNLATACALVRTIGQDAVQAIMAV